MKTLIIEDDALQAMSLLSCVIEVVRGSVSIACNGASAAALLHSQPWDLVMCDLMLPDVSPEEVVALVRDSPARHVFVTTFGESFTGELGLPSDAVIRKPIDATRLRTWLAATSPTPH